MCGPRGLEFLKETATGRSPAIPCGVSLPILVWQVLEGLGDALLSAFPLDVQYSIRRAVG